MSIENPSFEVNPEPEDEKMDEEESLIDKVEREREEERRAKMTPEQLIQEAELYSMAGELLRGGSTDRVDRMIKEQLTTVMGNKNWPEQTKKNTIRTIMKSHQQLKQQSLQTEKKLQATQERINELGKERKILDEQAKKAWAAVKEQMEKFGL